MICPRCGMSVPAGSKTCPTCNYDFNATDVGAPRRWCESCGSPIPTGHDVCPECGLPARGAFSEGEGSRFSVAKTPVDSAADDTGFVSAIPPEPERGGLVETLKGRPRSARLLLIAALAALVVVGGSILYIFKPWDPNAYMTHATTDADTSMEGFPGERPYLSSQDKIEEGEKQAAIAAEKEYIEQTRARLSELEPQLEALYDEIQGFLVNGAYDKAGNQEQKIAAIQSELVERKSTISKESYLEVEESKQRRDSTLVLIDYLKGAADVLASAWAKALDGSNDPNMALEVRAILAGESSEHGYETWHELFVNASSS